VFRQKEPEPCLTVRLWFSPCDGLCMRSSLGYQGKSYTSPVSVR
jgi:hypothetical protein